MFDATLNPDRVIAVDATTGNVAASLTLPIDYGTAAGVYDKTTGHLFVLDRRTAATRLAELNPATGAELGGFTLPFPASSEAGLTINPTTGNLWYTSDRATIAVELSRTGTLLRTVGFTLQGVPANSATGLAFDSAGRLLVSTTQGTIFRIDLAADPAAQRPATLTALTATATAGTPATPAASANIGQVIILTGTNFGPGTEVIFPTRDATGTTGVVDVTPLAIGTAGTTLQVAVPDTARTGDIKVVNTGVANQNLGFGSAPDQVIRQITLTYTPTAATSAITFADLGLQGLSSQSWGIDNVRVAQGATTVFQDNFEGGAKPNWSDPTTDATLPGPFSQFSGRFSGSTQTLALAGLTPNQPATLTFDLYVIDSWYGGSTSSGPNGFQVSADSRVLLSDTFKNVASPATQSYGDSAGLRLQIVPTLIASGQPGTDAIFALTGTGFQDGASTLTVGGVSFTDSLLGGNTFNVSGARDGTYTVAAPLTLDGAITLTTDGGSATLPSTVNAIQPLAAFTAIVASAAGGVPADPAKPSANTGQTITLTGQGLTSTTLVQFLGTDDTGATGTLTRTGTANAAGTSLTLPVPALARTGAVTVLGSGTSLPLQIVPSLRGVGGTVAAGNTLELDGTGLGGATITIDGKPVTNVTLRTVADGNKYNYQGIILQPGQQILTFTVPAGIGAGVIALGTAGGSTGLHVGIAVAASTLAPAADVGDTIATAQALTLPLDGRLTITGKIGDNSYAGLDVDLYQLTLTAGDLLGITATGGVNIRIFDATGVEIPRPANSTVFAAPATGTYYLGAGGSFNTTYNPATANSGASSFVVGTYTLQLERLSTGDSRLAAITATAAFGTPARTGVASGQHRPDHHHRRHRPRDRRHAAVQRHRLPGRPLSQPRHRHRLGRRHEPHRHRSRRRHHRHRAPRPRPGRPVPPDRAARHRSHRTGRPSLCRVQPHDHRHRLRQDRLRRPVRQHGVAGPDAR